MSRFKRCAKAAHASLRASFPHISLCQAQELLAAALGHKTLASFHATDSAAFETRAAYAVLDPEAAMLRALAFGCEMRREHWSLLSDELGEKQVIGEVELVEQLTRIGWSARYAFYDVVDTRIDALLQPYGQGEQFRQVTREALNIRPWPDGECDVPPILLAPIQGEICVQGPSHHSVVVPVIAEFGFERLGRRLYDSAVLLSIRRTGEAGPHCVSEDTAGGGGDVIG